MFSYFDAHNPATPPPPFLDAAPHRALVSIDTGYMQRVTSKEKIE